MFLKKSAIGVFCCLLLTACQGFSLWRSGTVQQPAPPDPAVQVKLEFQNLEHDGKSLYGRFLVGVEGGSIRLDKQLIPNISVTVDSVRTCDTYQEIPYIFADFFAPPPKQEHLLILEPGQWYGREISFLLLDEKMTGQPAPPCVEVEFYLTSFDSHILSRKRFRAWRKGERPPAEPVSPTQPPPLPELRPAPPAAHGPLSQAGVMPCQILWLESCWVVESGDMPLTRD